MHPVMAWQRLGDRMEMSELLLILELYDNLFFQLLRNTLLLHSWFLNGLFISPLRGGEVWGSRGREGEGWGGVHETGQLPVRKLDHL